MQRLEVSGAVRLIYRSLGVKGLSTQLLSQHFQIWQQNVFLGVTSGPVVWNILYSFDSNLLFTCCNARCVFEIYMWLTKFKHCIMPFWRILMTYTVTNLTNILDSALCPGLKTQHFTAWMCPSSGGWELGSLYCWAWQRGRASISV